MLPRRFGGRRVKTDIHGGFSLSADRCLRGAATYVDDIEMPGAVHGVVLRSPHAHARLRAIDTAAAVHRPGVLAIFSRDLSGHIRSLPCLMPLISRDGRPRAEPDHAILALDRATLAMASHSLSRKPARRRLRPPRPSMSTTRFCRRLWSRGHPRLSLARCAGQCVFRLGRWRSRDL